MRSHFSNQEWKLEPTQCRYTLGLMILDGLPSARVAAERTLYHEDLLQPHIFLQVHDPS
jgi:hypothetical protein